VSKYTRSSAPAHADSRQQPRKSVVVTPTPSSVLSERSDENTVVTGTTGSPVTPESHKHPEEKVWQRGLTGLGVRVTEQSQQRQSAASLMSPIDTSIPLPPGPWERTTPRAQTRQEVEDEWRRSRSRSSQLAGNFNSQHPLSLPPRIILTTSRYPRIRRS
jgi:hypothetical protein